MHCHLTQIVPLKLSRFSLQFCSDAFIGNYTNNALRMHFIASPPVVDIVLS